MPVWALQITALRIIVYFYTILAIQPTTTLYWGAPKTFQHLGQTPQQLWHPDHARLICANLSA
jgi:hypothetical protein